MTGVPVLAANIYRSVGLVILALVVVGVVAYVVVNVFFGGKPEVGAELELAPNRKPYLSDDELEGPKLDRSLSWALLFLVVMAIGLPLYWVQEPARQSNAAEEFGRTFAKEGEHLFAPTAEGGLNCAGCHGGMEAEGGVAQFNQTMPDGSVRQLNWKAPALNTVLLRYSREEVTHILTFGRPFSPMPAWGLEGNGPLNEQQVQTLVDYLETIQLSPEEAQQQARDELKKMMEMKGRDGRPLYESEGEALFNMGLTDGFAGGAYACARCHTPEWSYSDSLQELGSPAGGAFGPALSPESLRLQFPENTDPDEGLSPVQEHIDFVTMGSVEGESYGMNGQGTGRMPGFGQRPEEEALWWINKGAAREPGAGMLPPELIAKIVEYERSR